jgi:AcrR family transcriptional regulator
MAMDRILPMLSIRVSDRLFLKDPESSALGRNILTTSVQIIDEIGMERFTFKKLANTLQTTESSVYRYFENKHMLLLYMSTWYWSWLETYMVFRTANLTDPKDKLRIMISILCKDDWENKVMNSMNLNLLKRIVVSESPKAYMAKQTGNLPMDEIFRGFEQLCLRFEELFRVINPEFRHTRRLSSTMIEGVLQQTFYVTYLTSFSSIEENQKDDSISLFFYDMSMAMLMMEKHS